MGNGEFGFFQPHYLKSDGLFRHISDTAAIDGGTPVIRALLTQALAAYGAAQGGLRVIRLVQDMPRFILEKVRDAFGVPFGGSDEAYAIEVGEEISIFSPSQRGLLYGAEGFIRLLEERQLAVCLAYDSPVCPVRGIKIYLPAPQDIGYFKHVVDMACHYRYNTVVIEVGGAMQYLSHPEVNSGWVEYCSNMNRYSDRTREIQEKTFGWKKNSIHAENGGGQVLDRQTVADLVAYCKERFMDVIPEMPSLSHCDYLLTRHPELRERADDPYPDTYCPGNPDSYRLLFDLLGEVIEVFQPETLHIGHDEYYSIGLCPRCSDRDAAEIYAGDIQSIMAFLAERGVRAMVWGDKFLDAFLPGYGPCGGARIELHHPVTGEPSGVIPPTFRSIDLVPRTLQIMHWYWGVDSALEEQFIARGFNTVYGNFSGADIPRWKSRIARGIRGAVISNWSALKQENLQRNGFFYNLAYSSVMFWNPEYDDGCYEAVHHAVLQELLNYRLRVENPVLGQSTQWLEILHATDYETEYAEFVDGTFIDKEQDTLGQYILTYQDGGTAVIPVIYGNNISGMGATWARSLESESTTYRSDRRLREAAFMTCPVRMDGATWYRFICKNPRPDSVLTGIHIQSIKPGRTIHLKSFRITRQAE